MRRIIFIFFISTIVSNIYSQDSIDEINLLLIQGNYNQALEISNKVYSENMNSAEFNYQRALIFKLVYKYSQAVKSIKRAIQIAPENMDYLSEYGFILQKSENNQGAQNIFEQLINKDPYNLKVGLALSNMYLKDRKFEDAEKILLKLYKADSLNSYVARNIGIAKYLQGDSLSINWLKTAVKLDSTDIKAYKYLFSAYVVKEDFDIAFRTINKAQEIDSNNKSLYVMEGDIHVIRNHNYRAIPEYLKAIEIDSEDEDILTKLGVCYFKVNKFEKAKHYLLLADKKYMNMEVYKYLGFIYKELNTPDSSNFYFKKAYDILKPDYNTIFNFCIEIAKNYYDLKNYHIAIGWYDRALNLELTDIWARSHKNSALIDVASIYAEKLNNKQIAIEYLQKVTDDSTFYINDRDYYKYAQQQISKLKEELFFKGSL